MPCYDGRDNERVVYREDTTRVDNLAQMLCGVMSQLRERGIAVNDVPGLKKWWAAHQKFDEKRIKSELKEEARQRALDKLTDAERQLLGL